MKINEIVSEAWFSNKTEKKSDKKIVADYADTIIARYAKKYGTGKQFVPFDNKTGVALRDVIALGIERSNLLPDYNEKAIKLLVSNITDSYINFKLNKQIDDPVGSKVFRFA